MAAADQNAGLVFIVPPVNAINDRKFGTLVSEDRDLTQCFLEAVTVVWVARKAAHADRKAFFQRGGNADLATELIAQPGFAFGDAIDLGLMRGIDLVADLGLLMQELQDRCERGNDPIPQAAFDDVI